MKVDCYHSRTRPSYSLILPSGTKIEHLTGVAGDAAAKLFPFVQAKANVDLDSIAKGDLFAYLSAQISENGAGLIKTTVTFNEVLGD